MRRFYQKWGHVIGVFVFMVAANAANRCPMNFYQEKESDKVQKLRKY